MLKRLTVQEQFYHYVAGRDPTEKYLWSSFQQCACGQFMRDREINVIVDPDMYRIIWGRYENESTLIAASSDSLNGLAYGNGTEDDWTWGALRQRLEDAGFSG